MTLHQPQGAVVWGAPQKTTELVPQQYHTSMPTDVGSPIIFTLSRGGEIALETQAHRETADPEPHRAPWQGAAHPCPG